MRFSILLATLDRTSELHRFLRSLADQTFRDFEVLVIDQNPDDRLAAVLEPYSGEFPIRRLRCARGHSRAFNFGLEYASGDLVAFPDDDCWYDSNLLERVAAQLDRHPEWSGLTGREVVEPGFTSGGRWDRSEGFLTRANVFRRAISFTMFLRRDAATTRSFDETLGVGAGTRWGAGEETDYLLQLIADEHQIYYDPRITVWHQGRSGPYTPRTFAKAESYGAGMGRVLRRHKYGYVSSFYHLIRPLGGAALSLVSGRLRQARYHWSIFSGRTKGWLSSPPVSMGRPARSSRELISGGEVNLP